DKGEEPVSAIGAALHRHDLRAGRVTAVGGFQEAEVGWFDRERRDYRRIPVREQVEVLSLVGDVAARDGEPVLHVHAVLGRADGSTVGGHLLSARVWPTLEVIVTEVAPELAKQVDPETGLALIAGPGR
ncbi:PPC domain-containing DNA-binding protein, partial [Micromonospora sp. MH33]|uniref:PPC domain-containing DNA-binding protein n=2 Tax=Micromonospora TaxID=1873 RepID=UPI000D14A5DA